METSSGHFDRGSPDDDDQADQGMLMKRLDNGGKDQNGMDDVVIVDTAGDGEDDDGKCADRSGTTRVAPNGRKTFTTIKAVYFTLIAGHISLMPFITVYLADLGLEAIDIGRIKAVEPFVGLFAPAMCGSLADKYSKHKLMIVGSILGTGLVYGTSMFLPFLKNEVIFNVTLGANTTGTAVDYGHYGSGLTITFDPNMTAMVSDADPLHKMCSSCDHASEGISCSAFGLECSGSHLAGEADGQSGKTCISVRADNNLNSLFRRDAFESCSESGISTDQVNCSIFHEIWQSCERYFEEDRQCKALALNLTSTELLDETPCCHVYIPNDTDTSRLIIQRDTTAIFVTMMAVVFIGEMFAFPTLPLLDASTMTLINDYKEIGQTYQYGRQRFWGSLAVGVWSPISGLTVDKYISAYPDSFNGYLPAFVFFMAFLLLCGALASCIRLPPRRTPKSLTRNVALLLRKPRVMLFIAVVFLYGILCGFMDSFLFLFLKKELNATRTTMGLALTVTCLSEVTFMIFSSKLIEKLGHRGVISLAIFCFGLRFLGYSLLYNPWLVLPIELLHGVTFGAMWPACTSYINVITPETLKTTMQSLTYGTTMGLGKILGHLLGGVIFQKYGPRNLFRGAAVLGLITMIFFWSLSTLLSRREQRSPKNTESS